MCTTSCASRKLLLQNDADDGGGIGDGDAVVEVDIGSILVENAFSGLTEDVANDGQGIGNGHFAVVVDVAQLVFLRQRC